MARPAHIDGRRRVRCAHRRGRTGIPVTKRFPWDVYRKSLLGLSEPWLQSNKDLNRRQQVADFFFVRSTRRAKGLAVLFEAGLYSEALGVVRCGFEDWITYAYVLSGWSLGRWDTLNETVHQTDAKVFEGFRDLWGEAAANSHFAGMPAGVAKWVGMRPAGVDLASCAREVELEGVYRIAYPFLSAYSHPTTRPFRDLFDEGTKSRTARIPKRDRDEEAAPALWALWFETRILTLANRAYGSNVEPRTDELLLLLEGGVDFRTAVFVREVLKETA